MRLRLIKVSVLYDGQVVATVLTHPEQARKFAMEWLLAGYTVQMEMDNAANAAEVSHGL